MKVVVNGWDLAARPRDADSLGTLEWLNGLAVAKPELDLHLVVPKATRAVEVENSIKTHEMDVSLSAAAQIRFEQRHLVRFAAEQDVDVLYYPTGGAPLNSPLPVVTFSPHDSKPLDRSFLGRLGWAIRNAGMKGAFSQLCIMEPDVEAAHSGGEVGIPAWVNPAFNPLQQPADREALKPHALRPGFVVSFVQDRRCLRLILEVWRGLTDSVDPGQPLVLMGLPDKDLRHAKSLIHDFELGEWVKTIGGVSLQVLPALYRQAAFYLHGCQTRTGQELRWALATGLPVAGMETRASSRIVQQAGYLAPPEDVRGMLAACITVLVEPDFADQLRERGVTRASRYHQDRTLNVLVNTFRAACSG
jgi:glycosyltransferase involved in cell wall biosynthesis